MNTLRWQQAKQVLTEALAQPPENQIAFISTVCADDLDLQREVESLLKAYQRADGFIETPVVDDVLKLVDSDQHEIPDGRRIGRYKIIRKLGDGGMGAVYLAARADDQFEKQVAIKVVRFGLDNQFVINRFLSERQILANLEHPNIARLIDGDTTENGSPYLVMEYIEGLPIDEYCESLGLATTERLSLFRTVCAAVHYAHLHLVIHRDIKPSNVIVTTEGVPKLLDFGIAKLLDHELPGQGDSKTTTLMRLMTPEYASPEQVRGDNVTTATDIYSLGVVLYELLTGQRPHRLKSRSTEGMVRAICEEEPEKPSRAITLRELEVKGDDAKTTGRNAKLLSGDLDNIVLMALRKEPERRYESAAQFAADIQRHLDGLPVIARKDTFTYRTSKFVRRNRVAVAAAALVFISLLAGIIATTWQARAAARQARLAQEQRAKAESINAVLAQLLNYSNPVLNSAMKSGHETTMTEMLDEAAKRLDSEEFVNQPAVKAELERIVGSSYYGQGRYVLGRQHMEKYVVLEKQLYGENHPRALEASGEWASLLFMKGEMPESEKLFRQILPLTRLEQRKGNIKPETLFDELVNFAYLRRTQGDSKEAELLFREALQIGPQLPVESRYSLGITQSTLASTLADQGRFDEALETARAAVTSSRQRGDAERPDFGFSLTILGGFLTDKGDYVEADNYLREGETIFRRLLQPTHLWLGDVLRNEAISLYRQERFAEAETKVDEAIKIYLESFGEHYDNYPTALIARGLIFTKTGRVKEGEAILRQAVKLRADSLPSDHFWVALAKGALGECLISEKRFVEAQPMLLESFSTLNARLGARDPRTRESASRLVTFYDAQGKRNLADEYRRLL